MSRCTHDYLLSHSIKSSNIKYKAPELQVITEALEVVEPVRKRVKKEQTQFTASDQTLPAASTFPAPVIVPGDELTCDPEYPQQSVQEWVDEEHRNEVTTKRKTIYVVPPPALPASLCHLDSWKAPREDGTRSIVEQAQRPVTQDILDYLAAFYHGLPVKLLIRPSLDFTEWEDELPSKKVKNPSTLAHIGLSTGSEVIRIRCRPSQDDTFATQLNLDDLLDAAMSVLPKDAYALLMLVEQDIYENDDDDFCCGRAYGGSRVAVVSSARYRPDLDDLQKVDRLHSWPASHCREWRMKQWKKGPATKGQIPTSQLAEIHGSAVAAAVMAVNDLAPPTTQAQLTALWLGRVCKTASHELGHCFGIDHCMYFACIMQGTAGLAEDARQPPYLCPVDLAKVLRATKASEKDRYKALLSVCEKWKEDKMFAAFAAWIDARLKQPDAIRL